MYSRSNENSSSELCDRIGEVFRGLGFAGASIASVAESAGLSKASLYHHFPDGKLQMANRVVDRAVSLADATVFAPLRSSEPGLKRLDAMLDGYLAYTDFGKRPCLLVVLGQSAPEPIRARIRDQLRTWQLLVESTLCELRQVKPKRAARLAEDTLCGLCGGTLMAGLLGDPATTQRAIKRLRRVFEAHA